MLAKDENKVYSYGQELSKIIEDDDKIEKANSLKEGIEKSDIIICPLPFTKDGKTINTNYSEKKIQIEDLDRLNKKKILIGGNFKTDYLNTIKEKYLKIYDIMKIEEFSIFNTIATAEGTIQVAIENTEKVLQGAKVLVLGFGRVAKIVAEKFKNLSASVTCCARKKTDLAWINAYGYNELDIKDMIYYFKDFDIIINTVPETIINEKELKHMNSNVLLIDLASYPGGIDGKKAENMGLKYVWALALPGKVAPTSSAEFIKKIIYNIIEENTKNVELRDEKLEKISKKV